MSVPKETAAPRGFVGRGSVTALAGQGVKILIQVGSTAILGRLLAPSDFGMMGTVGPLLTFFIIFRDLGLTNVAVQRPNITQQEVSNLFWINVAAGLLLGLVVAALGRPVSIFYHDDRLTGVVLLLSWTFVANGISAQYMAHMQRHFAIGRLVFLDVLSSTLGIVAGIAAAWRGFGFWSLAVVPVVTQTLSLVLVVSNAGWQPTWPKWHREMTGLLRSGGGYAGFNLFNFLSRNLDQILIGRMLGETALGYYSRAYNLMLVPLSQVTNPLAQVMVPALARLTDDPQAYRDTYVGTMRKVMFFCCPLIAANIVGADWTVSILLGPRWAPTIGIYVILGLSGFVQPVGNSTGWLFISQGRSRDMFRWGVVSSVVTVTSFIVGLHWGVLGLAWFYTLAQFLIISPALWFWAGRHGPVGFRDLAGLALPFVLASAVDIFLFLCLRHYWVPGRFFGLFCAVVWAFAGQAALLSLSRHTRPVIRDMGKLAGTIVRRAASFCCR